MKKRTLLYFAIFFLILSGLTFFYERYRIPNVVDSVLDIKKEKVLYAANSIPKNTFITEEVINKNIKQIEVPSDYVLHNTVFIDNLIGRKTLVDIPAGVYLSEEFFINEAEGFKDGEQIYSFPVSMSNAVLGNIKPNDYVTIWVRYPNRSSSDGMWIFDSEVVVPYIKVEDLTDDVGTSILSGAASIQYAIIRAKRDIIQDIEIARKYEIFLTKYGENENLVPTKTFIRENHNVEPNPFINYIYKEEYLEHLESIDNTDSENADKSYEAYSSLDSSNVKNEMVESEDVDTDTTTIDSQDNSSSELSNEE